MTSARRTRFLVTCYLELQSLSEMRRWSDTRARDTRFNVPAAEKALKSAWSSSSRASDHEIVGKRMSVRENIIGVNYLYERGQLIGVYHLGMVFIFLIANRRLEILIPNRKYAH